MSPRHLTSINDLTVSEIENIFRLARKYLAELGDPGTPYSIIRSTDSFRGAVMATLFYEPSTRTRLSFESAMTRLGGSVISTADAKASSAVKGESLADSIRIVSAYADLVILRHPRDGAAKLAAAHATVPVINGGDGAHEHPTQTLCDLFTMQQEVGALGGLNVAVLGDLKDGRTVHSLVFALARFGATIIAMPAGGMDLPDTVAWRLHNDFGYQASKQDAEGDRKAIYSPPDRSHPAKTSVDVLYVTRFQRERASMTAGSYPVVNAKFLSRQVFRDAVIMHPLPRVDELDPALDDEPRAAYFRQAAYGVPIRMALITLLLCQTDLPRANRIAGQTDHRYDRVCANPNCISRDPIEAKTAVPKSLPVADGRRRCLYCEHESLDFG